MEHTGLKMTPSGKNDYVYARAREGKKQDALLYLRSYLYHKILHAKRNENQSCPILFISMLFKQAYYRLINKKFLEIIQDSDK